MVANYNEFIARILTILKANEDFASKISLFRAGDQGTEDIADSYPLCYVTTATQPEVERTAITSTDTDNLPGQRRTLEFWAVIIVHGATPEEAQAKLYDLTDMALPILEGNVQLKTPDARSDPLCAISDIFVQSRHEKWRGSMIEAVTIRIRPTIFATNNSYFNPKRELTNG